MKNIKKVLGLGVIAGIMYCIYKMINEEKVNTEYDDFDDIFGDTEEEGCNSESDIMGKIRRLKDATQVHINKLMNKCKENFENENINESTEEYINEKYNDSDSIKDNKLNDNKNIDLDKYTEAEATEAEATEAEATEDKETSNGTNKEV